MLGLRVVIVRKQAVPECSKSLRSPTFLPSTVLLRNSLPSFTLSSSSLNCIFFLQLLDSNFDSDRFSLGLLCFVVKSRNVFKLVFDNLTIIVKIINNTKYQKKTQCTSRKVVLLQEMSCGKHTPCCYTN